MADKGCANTVLLMGIVFGGLTAFCATLAQLDHVFVYEAKTNGEVTGFFKSGFYWVCAPSFGGSGSGWGGGGDSGSMGSSGSMGGSGSGGGNGKPVLAGSMPDNTPTIHRQKRGVMTCIRMSGKYTLCCSVSDCFESILVHWETDSFFVTLHNCF